MKRSIAILIIVGALLAIIAELTPTHMKVHGTEAHHNPELQVEYIENDPTGWAVANAGMGVGGVIVAIGMGLFARELKNISDNQITRMAGYLGTAMVILGALVFAIEMYYRVSQPPETILNDFYIASWIYPTYSLLTRIGIILIGYVLVQSGFSKKLGWVILVLGGLLLVLMQAGGPPGVNPTVFFIMGMTLLFKRSPSPQELLQTA